MNGSDRSPAAAESPALAAFLRGVGRRAIVLAELHCGDPERAVAALAWSLPRFAGEAGDWPMARWPARFWGLLLAAPSLRGATVVEPRWPPVFAGLAALGAGPRAALLLRLVAELDEDDAAAALGVDVATWRLALQRAVARRAEGGGDAEGWDALGAAGREAMQALPPARLAGWERACSVALAQAARPPPVAEERPRWLLPVLWMGVAGCAIALAASFAWPGAGNAVGDAGTVRVRRAPLPAPGAPAASFDAAFALRSHPDRELLLGAGAVPLDDLDLLSWRAARLAAPPIDAAPPPPVALAQDETLQQRVVEWDALPVPERTARRERWQAWLALPREDRSAVLDAAAGLAALPAPEQEALRMRFAQLSFEDRRGWLLGPRIGVAWPRLQPLLMQVPAAQREPLLAMLHGLSALQLDELATLAQRTPPPQRDALRRELLSTSDANRTDWLRERLQR